MAVKSKERPSTLTLRYSLVELGSSFERAGAAGLVMHAEYLHRFSGRKGMYEVHDLTESGFVLELNEQGLIEAFDDLYAAQQVERRYKTQKKDKETKKVIPPLREDVSELKDGKTQTHYIYNVVVPTGSFLSEQNESWANLHRELVFEYLHFMATQKPKFMNRYEGRPTKDAQEEWVDLIKGSNVPMDCSLMIGVQAKSANGVPFKISPQRKLLLRFWPLVAQAFRLRKAYDPTAKKINSGRELVVVVPDVLSISLFNSQFRRLLRGRSGETPCVFGTPRAALIDISSEGAFQFGSELQQQLEEGSGLERMIPSVSGFEVFHLDGDGRTLSLRSRRRLTPTPNKIRQYRTIRENYWDTVFKRQLVTNIVEGRSWPTGFDRLAETIKKEMWLGSYFSHDARVALGGTP